MYTFCRQNILTITLFVTFYLLCSYNAVSQNRDTDSNLIFKLTSGKVYSKYATKDLVLASGSVFRRGVFVNGNIQKKIYDRLHVATSITYQERMPFEALLFSEGSSGGVNIGFFFPNWPTNPQNEQFDMVDYAIRFPNFKYLHLDLLPLFNLNKGFFLIEGGLGPFLGFLLNRNQTTVTKELFHERFHWQFENAKGNPRIEYRNFDAGICSKLSVGIKLSKKSSLLFSAVYSYSLSRLNNTRISRGPFSDENLKWRTLLLGVTLQRCIKL